MRTLVLTLALALAMTGCTSETSEQALPQGLTVLEAEAGSLSLAYRSADVVIFMQAERGHETPEPYRSAPDMPDYEIDTMFTDEAGYAFYTRMGGDGWVDESWRERLAAQGDAPPVGSNAVLYRLAGEAADVMEREITEQLGDQVAADFAPEIEALLDFAAIAPGYYADELRVLNEHRAAQGEGAVEVPRILTDENGDVVYGTPGACGQCQYSSSEAAYYYIRVGTAGLWYSANLGEHSATTLHRWTSEWLRVHDANNHGSAGSGMGQKCLFQYYDTTANGDFFTNITQGFCSGNYEWDSDGGDGGHNCHDDTRIQLYNFYYANALGQYGTRWRWCDAGDRDHDISVNVLFVELDQNGSPECNTSTNRGVGSL